MGSRLQHTVDELFSGPLNRKQRSAIIDLLDYAEGIGITSEAYGATHEWPQMMKDNFRELKSLKARLSDLSQ